MIKVVFTSATATVVFFTLSMVTAYAQVYRTDGGAIVVEDSVLLSNKKQIIFVVTRNISEDVTVSYQTISSDGQLHAFPGLHFPNGLTKGQVIPLWDGSFNMFQTTPWLGFSVIVATPMYNYFVRANIPINYLEQYREPMIVEISEEKMSGIKYIITAKGNFDTYEPSTVVINGSIIVPQKAMKYERPGKLIITVDEPHSRFVPGKYLLTVCQTGLCDTMVGRHRQ